MEQKRDGERIFRILIELYAEQRGMVATDIQIRKKGKRDEKAG